MNTPDDDSPWSSLAEELGLDSTPAKSPPANLDGEWVAVDEHDHDMEDTVVLAELHAEPVCEDSEEGDETDGPENGEAPGEAGRRKKRRRRRKKKGGATTAQPGETAVATDADNGEEADAYVEEEAEEYGSVASVAQNPDESNDNVMRDIVATWNVPSWEQIVTGLYRPGH